MAQIVSLSVPNVPAGVEGKEEGVGAKSGRGRITQGTTPFKIPFRQT